MDRDHTEIILTLQPHLIKKTLYMTKGPEDHGISDCPDRKWKPVPFALPAGLSVVITQQ